MCEIKVGPTRVWSCKIVIAWRNWHDLAGRKNAILTLKGTVFTCPLISRFRNSYYTAWHSPIFEKRLRMSVIWLIRDLYLVKILPLLSTGNDRKFFPVSTFGWDLRDSQACNRYLQTHYVLYFINCLLLFFTLNTFYIKITTIYKQVI
jgi:hypothetical protein